MATAGCADSWVEEYNSAVEVASDITNMMSDYEPTSSLPPIQARRHSAAIRRTIMILCTRLDGLQSMKQINLTDRELLRRREMANNLRTKANQMAFKLNMLTFTPSPPAATITRSSDTTLLADDDDMMMSSRSTTSGIEPTVGLQREIMREQDDALEELEEMVMSTKHIAIAVNEELDLHTKLIDNLEEHVQHTDSKLHWVRTRLAILNKRRTVAPCDCHCVLLYVAGILLWILAVLMLLKYL